MPINPEMYVFGVILLILLVALVLLGLHHARHPEYRSAPMTEQELDDWCGDLLFPPFFDPYSDDDDSDEE